MGAATSCYAANAAIGWAKRPGVRWKPLRLPGRVQSWGYVGRLGVRVAGVVAGVAVRVDPPHVGVAPSWSCH